MTVTPLPTGPLGRPGLPEKLLAAVRPEFRVDVLVPDADDPVLGWKRCPISDCNLDTPERATSADVVYGGTIAQALVFNAAVDQAVQPGRDCEVKCLSVVFV